MLYSATAVQRTWRLKPPLLAFDRTGQRIPVNGAPLPSRTTSEARMVPNPICPAATIGVCRLGPTLVSNQG